MMHEGPSTAHPEAASVTCCYKGNGRIRSGPNVDLPSFVPAHLQHLHADAWGRSQARDGSGRARGRVRVAAVRSGTAETVQRK